MKILFVCLGNICRSPAGEGIFRDKVEKAHLTHLFEADSAGTAGYHIGQTADDRMIAHCRERGYDITPHRARKLSIRDLQEYDLILAMDSSNLRNILSLDHSGKYSHKVKMITDYINRSGVYEVPDPYYDGRAAFHHVIDLLEEGCDNLLQDLLKRRNLRN